MHATTIRLPFRRRARVEIIPLIGVIFFLLATFVLFTLSLNRIQSVPVTLPGIGGKDVSESVTIQVSSEGALYWNREPVEMVQLASRLAAYKQTSSDPRVLIAGDDKARFGTTVRVLDKVRKTGIDKFSVETHTRPTGK